MNRKPSPHFHGAVRYIIGPTKFLLIFLSIMTVLSTAVNAQLLNGDFSSGLDHWTVLRMPDRSIVPGGLESIDIDGSGPLGMSEAYGAGVGHADQRRLEQNIFLLAGLSYEFGADLVCVPYSNNADGGTVTMSIGGTTLGVFAFGGTTFGVNEYGQLSGTYVAQVSGLQTLSIDLSRAYFAGGGTPVDYIDNIRFAAVPEPSATVLLALGGLAFGVVALMRRLRGAI